MKKKSLKLKSYHVSIAAEAFAAGMFAQTGYDVSVQYGANQPDYDLIIKKGNKFLSVSVKGTQVPGWTFSSGYKRHKTYHKAADLWMKKQKQKTIFCLVHLPNNLIDQPAIYIAKPREIANELKRLRHGEGGCALPLNKIYMRGKGKGTEYKIPNKWKFSQKRIKELMKMSGSKT